MGDPARVTVTTYLDSAHKLPESLVKEGLTTLKCCRLHGHTYKIQVIVTGEIEQNIIVDFGKIKGILSVLDHVYLNDVFEEAGWGSIPTTAENLCNFIEVLLRSKDVIAKEITIWEGYKGENTNVVKKVYR